MSDDPDKLERELRGMIPRRVPDGLTGRIGREIARVDRRRVAVRRSLAAAAAMLVLAAGSYLADRGASPGIDRTVPEPECAGQPEADVFYVPVATASILLDERDEGPVMIGDPPLPARRFRRVFAEHRRFVNSQGGSVFTVTRPREEIVLASLPVH